MFFSSHVLSEVERVCDRVGILQDGRLTAVNSVGDLRAELGMGAVVEATLETSPDGLELDGIDGVTDVAIDGRSVRVACASPGAKMPLLRRIDRAGTVADVTIEETPLETLFEEYTADATEPTDAPGTRRATAGGGSR